MKVFLDTNVLVSAMATRGLCADVLREILTSHQLVVSVPLFNELKRVLREKLQIPGELINDAIEILQQDAHFATPQHFHMLRSGIKMTLRSSRLR